LLKIAFGLINTILQITYIIYITAFDNAVTIYKVTIIKTVLTYYIKNVITT